MTSKNYDCNLLWTQNAGTQNAGLRTQNVHTCMLRMRMLHACILCMHTYNAHARAHAHKKTGEPQAKSSPDHRWGARSAPQPRRRRGFCGLGSILLECRLFFCVHARVRVCCMYVLYAVYVCMLCPRVLRPLQFGVAPRLQGSCVLSACPLDNDPTSCMGPTMI